jgi:cell division septum initiation protein DivIVA
MDILFLIEKLEKLVQDSRKVPMSNGRIVNEQSILEIVDQLRTTIPEEVKAARQIQQQKERIIAQGKEEANRIIDIARQQANGILTNHELLRAAEARSQTIIERAQREAADIRRGADGYAEQVLTVLDERIAHAQHQIRSGLLELGSRHAETAPVDDNKEKPPEAAPSDPAAKPPVAKTESHG